MGHNHAPVVFTYEETGAVRSLPLYESDVMVSSVAGAAQVYHDTDGRPYYVKHDDGQEYAQLALLHDRGIPVPRFLLRHEENGRQRCGTSYAGQPLHQVLADRPSQAQQLLHSAGILLNATHTALNTLPLPTSMVTRTYANTSQSVDCFFYKYTGQPATVSVAAYQRHKRGLAAVPPAELEAPLVALPTEPFIAPPYHTHSALTGLIATANLLARGYLDALSPYRVGDGGVYLSIPDTTYCYGDYKPENILVDTTSPDLPLTIIDPVITKGSAVFDLAEFSGRLLIDQLAAGESTRLAAFYEGYGSRPAPETLQYGPFMFAQLITIDMLNILRSYVKRYSGSQSAYRLVRALDAPDFCRGLTQLLQQTAAMRTTKQFDVFLQ